MSAGRGEALVDDRLAVGPFVGALSRVGEVGSGLGEQVGEPVGDRAARPSSGRRWSCVLGEVAAGAGGGGVGAVDGEDLVEDVAGVGEVVGVGDDVEVVLVAAAGGGDVQAAAGGRRAGDGEADVDGVGLPAVLGGGVAEPDVLAHVVGGQRDRAVAVAAVEGQAAVGVDGGDGPGLAVADRFAGAGDEAAVVAAGHHDVADVGGLTAGDRSQRSSGRVARRRGGRSGRPG